MNSLLYKCCILFFSLLTFKLLAQETMILDENFDKNDNEWWVGKESDKEAKISKGIYQFKNNNAAGNRIAFTIKNLDANKEDFTIETRLRLASGKNTQYFGLLFSLTEDGNFYKKCMLTSNGEYSLEDCAAGRCYVLSENLQNNIVEKGTVFNVLKLVKKANIITCFINGKQVFKTGLNGLYGNRIAFFCEPKMKLEIDYLKVWKSPRILNLVEDSGLSGKPKKLSNNVNSEYHEIAPVLSADGLTMCFVRHGHPQNVGINGDRNDQDIWFSKKSKNGTWSKALSFGKPLNNNGPNAVVSISPDNNSMIVAHTYQRDGSFGKAGLSITKITGERWSLPQELIINEYYNKNEYVSYFLCSDNKTLLFSLERKDTEGGRDLYVSFLLPKGDWSAPKNLGKVLNTFGDDSSPFMASDNKTLYFSSDGHAGYGNFDLFVTKRLDDSWTNWSEPQNLGPNINSDAYEMSLFADAKGEFVYLIIDGDIYVVENPKKPEPIVLIQGTVYNKKTNKPMEVEIKYFDLKTNKELGFASSNSENGAYKIVLPAGAVYSYQADKNGFYAISNSIDVTELKEYTEKTVDLYLVPIEKGETFLLNNIFFEYNKAVLQEASFAELERLLTVLKENPTLTIEIGGHTDNQGSVENNKVLSQQRADAVVAYLQEKGIAAGRLKATGYGASKPLVANDSEENRAQNRRVEFKIL